MNSISRLLFDCVLLIQVSSWFVICAMDSWPVALSVQWKSISTRRICVAVNIRRTPSRPGMLTSTPYQCYLLTGQSSLNIAPKQKCRIAAAGLVATDVLLPIACHTQPEGRHECRNGTTNRLHHRDFPSESPAIRRHIWFRPRSTRVGHQMCLIQTRIFLLTIESVFVDTSRKVAATA